MFLMLIMMPYKGMLMNKKIIIVTGCVASGKTVFSSDLSYRLMLPCFSKDTLKIALGKSLLHINGKELSKATFNVMVHVMNELMQVGRPLIIEGPFNNEDNRDKENEEKIIRSLVEKHGYRTLTFVFYGNMNTLYDRFIQRDQLPDRDSILRVNGLFDDIRFFKKINNPLKEFAIGETIMKVDTTDFKTVDFDKLMEAAYSFIYND